MNPVGRDYVALTAMFDNKGAQLVDVGQRCDVLESRENAVFGTALAWAIARGFVEYRPEPKKASE